MSSLSCSKYSLAYYMAQYFHAGQLYGDKDYFKAHVLSVEGEVIINYSTNCEFTLNEARMVALLHDIIEDTNCEIGTIFNCFGHIIGEAVLAINKQVGVSRIDYLVNLKLNPLALYVKICDAKVNLRKSEQDGDTRRIKRYKDTLEILGVNV